MSITLNTITNPDRLALINSNFSKIAQAINESLLWRNGNTAGETLLTRDVDFNSNQILNAYVGEMPLSDIVPLTERAEQAADDAEASLASTIQVIQNAGDKSTLVALALPTGAGLVGLSQGGFVQDAVQHVTPKMFGAKADGVTNDTAAFQSCITSGREVVVPAGNYVVSLNTLILPTNSKWKFDKKATVFLTNTVGGSAANQDAWLFKVMGSIGTPVTNVSIEGGNFTSADDRVVILAINSYTKNIEFKDSTITGARAVHLLDGTGVYANSTSTTRPQNIKVSGLVGNAGTVSTVNAFVQTNFVDHFTIKDIYCYGYYFGVQFWGGNSDPASNGAVANERKCTNGLISNVTAYVVEAGIWGSMAKYVYIEDSYVEAITTAGSDVGLDFEGCVQCSATSSTAKNFLNGCIATFFYSLGVSFVNCDIITDNSTARAGRFNNTAQDLNSKDITVLGCTFIGSGFVTALTQNGSSDDIKLINNTFINCLVYLIANNNGHHYIQGNSFYFDVIPTLVLNSYSVYAALHVGAFHGVSGVGGRKCTIKDNTFRSTVTWAGVSTPIFTLHTSTSFSTFSDIQGGGVLSSGWTYDFVVLSASTGTATKHRWQVRDYQMFVGSYSTMLASGATAYPEGLVYGKDQFGRPFPSTTPTLVYLLQGQKIDSITPAASGFIGSVVTTSGYDSAAVLKTYGAISA